MYSEWASLQREIQTDTSHRSVLHTFPKTVGKDVSGVVVKTLAESLSVSAASNEPSQLNSDKEIQWTMEVLCYGLSLPLSENDTIKDCVSVYCDWLTALTSPKSCVPRPVVDDPNPYVQLMLGHLYNLFVPRPDAGSSNTQSSKAYQGQDLLQRQVVCCHRVLRTLQAASKESTVMTRETWDCLLKFLLAINDALLAPPTVRNSIGEQLCERVLSVLFEVWILACERCFPAPPLWKTFREMFANWRHHEEVVSQWHRINVAFTAKLLKFMYGIDYPELPIREGDQNLIPENMSNDCISQCWFRFLHLLSNPVDLSRPHIISQTPVFLRAALSSQITVEPHKHECLKTLPHIFHKAMKGISVLVDAFLGLTPSSSDEISHPSSVSGRTTGMQAQPGYTPPPQRRTKSLVQPGGKGGTKSALSTPKPASSAGSTPTSSPSHVTLDSRPPLASQRPKVNSILHLLGTWLVEASIVGIKVYGSNVTDPLGEELERLRISYEAGRAEACGALCRIFCSHKTGEEILPVYLSRFYIAMYYGLEVKQHVSGTVLANIIFNSCNLLRVDLDGVLVLVPRILQALELVLHDLQPSFKIAEQIPAVELRKASIHLLLSMLALPLHFKMLPIKHIFGEKGEDSGSVFLSLKARIIDLLLRALTVETDTTNTQMLLGGLLLCVLDLSLCEEAEQNTLQPLDDGGGPPSPSVHDATTDSASGLFGHAASLVCNRLMASWKMDLNIALATIEVLSGLAKVKLSKPNLLMCKRTVNWICEFIVYQCSRPAPAHSKDLHSMIVAAFHCLTLWMVEHDYLMQDKECLQGVLEVVELGISGTKSQPETQVETEMSGQMPHKHKHDRHEKEQRVLVSDQNRASDIPKLKGEKDLKPVSLRVRDAAEGLLTVIMDHVGSFPPPCGPESVCSLLDEDSLLKYCKDGGLPEQGTPFRYFVLDGTIIVGLHEQPLGNDEDPLPTVVAIIRGPFGKHAWTLQLRHLPRYRKEAFKAITTEPSRPQPMNNVGTHYNVNHRYFPEIVDKVPLMEADKSIPRLESVMTDQSHELRKLEGFIRDQVTFEKKVQERVLEERKRTPYPDPQMECKQPSVCHDFQTARLFLSHYGFLSLEALKDPPNSSIPPAVVILDSTEHNFLTDLDLLDCMPCRTADTAHIFYVKSGQKMPFEILSNVVSQQNVQPTFIEFLRSLGWPVDVKKHAGWTGHVNTSWKIQAPDDAEEVYPGDTGGSLFDGRQQVLYWADVSTEVAFVVPSPETYIPMGRRNSADYSEPRAASKVKPPRRKRISLPVIAPNPNDLVIPGTSFFAGKYSASVSRTPRLTRAQATRHATNDKAAGALTVPSAATKPPRVGDMSSMKPKSLSLDLDKPPERASRESVSTPTDGSAPRLRRSGARIASASVTTEAKVFVVWLESYEDHENFPALDLVASTGLGVEGGASSSSLNRQSTEPSLYVIFIHALQNGLFRVHMQGQSGKMSMAIPLVDGMVVSRRALGSLVRQTAINICRRKRLENESCQPPHVRRKLKIKEMVDKYRNRLSEPEFYTALFYDVV